MKNNKSKFVAFACGSSLVIALGMTAMPCLAQLQVPGFGAPTSGGLFGSSPVVLIGDTSKALQDYFKKHGHLPQAGGELDDALKAIYSKLNGAEPSQQPAAEKEFHVLGNIMLGVNNSLKSTTLDDLRKNPPANFKAPQNRIVVSITDANQFLVWYSASDGRPAVDALGQAIILRQECSKD
jgi:hypothetical protein